MLYELIYAAFGYSWEITINNLWFYLAWLPVILGFALEIIFSFIYSFRVRQPKFFIPWRASSYRVLLGRLPANYSSGLVSARNGRLFSSSDNPRSLRLLSFSRVSPSSGALYHESNARPLSGLPVERDRKSNKVQSFSSRFHVLVTKFHGFKQKNFSYHGRFFSVFGKNFWSGKSKD
jgi:hypothetical protein